MAVAGGQRRRRRRPEEATREILDAARALLVARPTHEVTVAAIMHATTLSRKSFYVYFRDRYELITRLVDPLRSERDGIIETLLAGLDADLPGAVRTALRALAQLYAEHGALLRALAEASRQDGAAKRAWRAFLDPVIDGHAQLIREEIARGRITGLEPEPTARALIGMNLQVFFDELVDAAEPPVDLVADRLLVLWVRALYGQR